MSYLSNRIDVLRAPWDMRRYRRYLAAPVMIPVVIVAALVVVGLLRVTGAI